MTTTTDLSQFGLRGLAIAGELLIKYAQEGKRPDDFEPDGVTVMMNTASGNVFLTNSEYQVAMLNDGELKSFYSCPQCGHEGFKEEMSHNLDNADCREYLEGIGVIPKHLEVFTGDDYPRWTGKMMDHSKYYYWFCNQDFQATGDGGPFGPFETEADAYAHAIDSYGDFE